MLRSRLHRWLLHLYQASPNPAPHISALPSSHLTSLLSPPHTSHLCSPLPTPHISALPSPHLIHVHVRCISLCKPCIALKPSICIYTLIVLQGPVVNDLGGLPPSHRDISLSEFQSLLDAMPCVRTMTISPHLDAPNNYLRIQALVNR